MNVTNVRLAVGAGLVIGALAIAGCSGGGANPAASAPAQPTLAASGALAPGAGAGAVATPGAAQSSSNSTAGGPDTGAPGGAEGAVPGGGEGGVPGGGEAAFATYTDPAGAFSFAYTSGWAKSIDARGAILFQGRNQSVRFRLADNAGSDPAAFAASDAGTLGTEFPGFHQISLAASATLPGAALLTFEWQGTNAVTGKAILEHAERYYIPASGGRMAVLTYSAPPSQFDPQNSADLARSVRVR